MDTRKTPLFANLDRALRKAYSGPIDDSAEDSSALNAAEPEPPVPEALGRYRVRGVIARGGMGAVLRAEDPELGRDVAIKVSRSRDPALLELFANEARICSQLQHPGIVPVYERGRTEDARPYYVMKLIEGETLATILAARPAAGADARRMLEIFTAVCQTMAYVHARGFFHGDLKPGNIMVGAFGEVQVMDWGIAGEAPDGNGENGPREKKAPLAVGTPAYMPPERARGDRDLIGVRSDVFSLGAILCEILAGDPPYLGSHRSEIYRKAVNADLAEALARLDGSGADHALVVLARDCLAVDPAARPADAEAVAHRLSEHVNAVARRAREAEIDLARAHARHASERRARRLTLALAAAVILGLVAGGIGFVLLRDEKLTRQADAARIVDEALVVAHQELAEARVTRPPDPERWAGAEAAAVRAVTLAERSSADAATVARARALQAETHTLRANRLRYLALQERIEDIEHHGLEEDRPQEWLDSAYRRALEENGIDVGRLAAEPPADDGSRGWLSLALARWALARGRASDAPTREDLLQAAMSVDPDPDRKELCSAFMAGDHERLLRASRSEEKMRSSPESLLLLSRFLVSLNHVDESTAVLRAACAAYPGDFRVHHDLAARLGVQPRPPYEEIIRLLSMCVAIRPASAHALIDLGGAYHANEQLELAATALEKASTLQPSHPRGWIVLALVRRDMGETKDATSAANAAVGCESDAEGLVRMASMFWARALYEPAKTALAKAVEVQPKHARARLELGRSDYIEGDYEGAINGLREAVEIAPRMAVAWSSLGLALSANLSVEDARDALEKAVDLGEPSVDLALEYAGTLFLAGNPERALEAVDLADQIASNRQDGAAPARLAAMRLAGGLSSPADAIRMASAESRAPRRAGELARAAFIRGWFMTSATLYEDAAGTLPGGRATRIEAARSASLAGRGFGSEGAGLDPARRAELRVQALGLLRAALDESRKSWEADHLVGPAVRRSLRSWKVDAAFPSERRPDFESMPAAEKESWTRFWSDVGRLLTDLDALVLPPGVTVRHTLSAKTLGVPGPLAGVQFAADGSKLYLIGNAGFRAGSIHALPVIRDAAKEIVGFGPAQFHAKAEHADGGLTQAEGGTFYWSTWREHQLGELAAQGKPKSFPLAASGVPAGGGGLAFVPAGSRAGALLMSGYVDGGLYTLTLSEAVEGVRAPVPGSAALVASFPKGIEGIRFVPAGPLAGSLLVANWDAGVVSLVATDPESGLPVVGENQVCQPTNFISGVEGASGLDCDPVTGDLVVTSWGSGNQVLVLGGVAATRK